MQSISLFDMFKIGVGPSSSHTMGPWLAARRFVKELPASCEVSRVVVELFGSLAKTGKGHGTDIAVQLGLCGHQPETIVTEKIDQLIRDIADQMSIRLHEQCPVAFDPNSDIVFQFEQQLPFHPNGMKFTAYLSADDSIAGDQVESTFYSIGGGFIVKEGESLSALSCAPSNVVLPFPIESAEDLLRHCESESISISEIVLKNEQTWRSETEIATDLAAIKNAMLESIHRGCRSEGTLPGGLGVQRRAARMATKLLGESVPEDLDRFVSAIRKQQPDFQCVLDWVSCFALAVNEENAAFGRVVTAPTNGAAGVIPAVMLYYLCFCDAADETCVKFLMTASEIGCIFKKGATISAAQGGCQAEIGVSSAMAAGALAETMGGTPAQVAEAAEIAMEHHLGMTCDPIRGLVQIPCIERNAMGAIKAITAAQIALQRDASEARVSLDAVVRTMWETAQDMNSKYKETSEGGLAVQIAVNQSEC